jgi:peptidoglycan/xylan/chitin deacetylase (PgdA/CDA1 family)
VGSKALKALALIYHDIVESDHDTSGFSGPSAARYKITWQQFDAHLQAIAEAGGKPQLIEPSAMTGSGRVLALTFDDGGASALRAGQRLAEYGWPGYFFIISDCIDKPSFLDADGIRELRAMRHFIGTHSRTHPERISSFGDDELLREWTESKARLSELLGEHIAVGSVPGGYYSARVARAAAKAGIDVLFTSEPRLKPWTVDGCLVLGRYSIRRGTPAATPERLVSGKSGPLLRQATGWYVRKVAKSLPGDPYSKLRSVILRRI